MFRHDSPLKPPHTHVHPSSDCRIFSDQRASRPAARVFKNSEEWMVLTRDRFSAGARIRMKSATKMQETHNQARARGQSPCAQLVPSFLCKFHASMRSCATANNQNISESVINVLQPSAHARSHTLAFSQPSRQHHRPMSARNYAFLSTPSPALPIGGSVFSWEM